MTEAEVSEATKLSPRTLQRMRQDGGGPPFIALTPGRIGYLRGDVLAWLHDRRVSSTSAATVARLPGRAYR